MHLISQNFLDLFVWLKYNIFLLLFFEKAVELYLLEFLKIPPLKWRI
ncbi:hypothetical protein DB41_DW00130 [Neochlamydia sp. TUME1]|nr:hypothetical protein DB41_DW00130 [Neochlamydia sp. TUME1]